MLPLMVDVRQLPIAVVGNSFAAAHRLRTLARSGAKKVFVFSPEPEAEVIKLAGDTLKRRLPTEIDFTENNFRVVYVCDIDETDTLNIIDWTHDNYALVNVHDRQEFCDFHMPAILRRGDLQVTVSTGGRVAGLSRILRDHLRDTVLGPEWGDRVHELGEYRDSLVVKRRPFSELKMKIEDFVKLKKWL